MGVVLLALYYLAIFLLGLVLVFNLPFSPLSNKNKLPRNWPVVGMLPGLMGNFNNLLEWTSVLIEDSGITTFLFKGPWFCNLDLLITIDPANIKYTSSTRFPNFPRGPKSREMFDLFGEGIFNLDGKEWEVHRDIHRAFFSHKESIEKWTSHVFEKAEEGLMAILDHVATGGQVGGSGERGVLDLEDLFSRYTYDLTCKMVVGSDPQSLSLAWPQVMYTEAINNAMQSVFMRHVLPEMLWKLLRWLGIGHERTLRKSEDTLDKMMKEMVSWKHDEFNNQELKTHKEFGDILTTYLMQEDYYSDEFLKVEVKALLFAGSSTTAAALTWFFWILSKHPSIVAKIRDEIALLVPNDYREMSKLVYLHAAICETLRLYPPVPFQTRAPLEPDILPSGHEVNPNSTMIVIPLYNLARSKLVWGEDCIEFKPERWIAEDGGFKHEPSHKFFSFNSGPRICPGREVAFKQMKAAIATILHNYNVEVLQDQKFTHANSAILQAKYGLRARVTKRSDTNGNL